MIHLLFFCVSLLSSLVGAICGVGGGVIIKPVLDATGTMSVGNISFLSGTTVLCMSVVSVLRNRTSKGLIEYRTGTPLAVGAIAGGLLGKELFDIVRNVLHSNNRLGAVQAGLLILITTGTFIYTAFAGRIHTRHFDSILLCGSVGLVLGTISAFLGIGGGPINLMVLNFFFSMEPKKAAANSLYIIMLSQFSGLFQSVATRTVPKLDPLILLLMVAGGVTGSMIGSLVNKRISDCGVSNLFMGFMGLVICVCIYNLGKFLTLG